jgi:uncharacterized membrane protein YesL
MRKKIMAGFFGLFDYSKPGPGVPKDAPPKAPIIVFFEILQRKFWNIIKVNLMNVLFSIPITLLGMLVLEVILPIEITEENAFSNIIIKFVLMTILMCTSMVVIGPVQAGITYILRNYSREEHAFLWGDFKETAAKNMKQSLIVGAINFFVTFFMIWSLRTYILLSSQGMIMTIGATLLFIAFAIFACMNMYVYPIMITFDLKIKQIYKNALIFAVIKFLPNLGILLLNCFLILLSFGAIIPFNPLLGIILYLFITVGLTGFITNFYVYPKLKKYMISRIEDEDEEEEDEEDEEDEDVEDDIENDPDESNESGEEQSPVSDTENRYDENNDSHGTIDDDGVTGDDGVKRYF